LQNLPVGFHRQSQLVQHQQIMGTGEANGGFFEPGLEVLFSALLSMENSGIITRVFVCAVTHLRDMPVFLGLMNQHSIGFSPTTPLYLALGLTPLPMREIGAVVAPLPPGDEREDLVNAIPPQG
jgi:hypothetical protein